MMRACMFLAVVVCGATTAVAADPPRRARERARAKVELRESREFYASFDGDELAECTEVAVTGAGGPVGTVAIDESTFRIPKPCAEQFAELTPLASCTVRAERGSRKLVLVSRFYRFAEVFEDGRRARECLAMGGEWSALPRDSATVVLAQLRSHARERRRLLKPILEALEQ